MVPVLDLAAAVDLAGALAGAAFFSAGGELDFLTAAVFLASFTGPEGPFGRSNSPLFSPEERAEEMCWLMEFSVVLPRLLLAWMYFLIA